MWFTWQIKRIEVADPIKMEELRYEVLFFFLKLYLLSNEKFLHVYIIICIICIIIIIIIIF